MNKYIRYNTYLMGDFETTTYEGIQRTEVWAGAIVDIFHPEHVEVVNSLTKTWMYIRRHKGNIVCFFHNLKFDGHFWISYFLEHNYKTAYMITETREDGVPKAGAWIEPVNMENNSFQYLVSNNGQWYTITIKVDGRYIQIRDSLKLLPFSVRAIGKAFGTKHQKTTIEYEGVRHAGEELAEVEKEYIGNDVLVPAEALQIMFDEGHKKLTIGSCCMQEFKKTIDKQDWATFFPNLVEMELDPAQYGSTNVDEYIRKSYKGGWCYLVKGKENRVLSNGLTLDVNSLYPSVMDEANNRYPVGKPKFWKGDYIDEVAQRDDKYFFVRLRCSFRIKPGYLPFIQMKNTFSYQPNECLETSDVFYNEEYHSEINIDGHLEPVTVELTLTQTDYERFLEHYDVWNFEILDGCYFSTETGYMLFDWYIDKYRQIKVKSKGARRTLAKLFLNNLYGKFATSTDSSYKLFYLKEDGSLGTHTIIEKAKDPFYIPIGSAITSYARDFTIRAAQKNFHGADQPGFAYADTDSLHMDGITLVEVVGAPLHDTAFSHWKCESYWDLAIFARQKTYIEHVTHEDMEPVKPYYNIKCAGMPERCKHLLDISMGTPPEAGETFTMDELEFISKKRSIWDFKPGLCVPGKLIPKRIPGGIVLTNTTYEMR